MKAPHCKSCKIRMRRQSVYIQKGPMGGSMAPGFKCPHCWAVKAER